MEDSFQKFKDQFPALTLLGNRVIPRMDFNTQQYYGAQLVCKYLLAAENDKLDRLFSGIHYILLHVAIHDMCSVDFSENAPPMTIESIYRNQSPDECSKILQRSFPSGISGTKILEAMYLRYVSV